MAVCRLSKETFIHGVTPVHNLFIAEFLPVAPADFVKVYLYAYMACYNQQDIEMEDIGRDLSLEQDVVSNAFSYWERKGLLNFSRGKYEFLPMQSVVASNLDSRDGALNKYKDFNNALTLVMDNRLLLPDDFLMAYDWIEVYGMSEDCILTMVSYAVNEKYKKGNKVSFSTLNKLAASWAEKGIKTSKQAEEHIAHKKLVSSGAATLLQHLGIYGRGPTVDEFKLYTKWTQEYGFTLEAILKACSEMVYSKNPSFALLNTILEKYKEQNVIDASGIETAKEEADKKYQLYRNVLERCGVRGNATMAHKKLIDGLIEKGFDEQGLLYICDSVMNRGKSGLPAVEELANTLIENNITEENAVCEYLDKRDKGEKRVKAFLTKAGFSRNPSVQDVMQYEMYLSAFGGNELIMDRAAELASGSSNKTETLKKLLNEWKAQGVKELSDIKTQASTKSNPALHYEQRDSGYSEQQLFDNL